MNTTAASPESRISGVWLAAMMMLVILSYAGCSSTGTMPPATVTAEDEINPFSPDQLPPDIYRIRPGDGLSVRFLYNQELDVNSIQVRDDGNITIPVIGDVPAAGATSDELTAAVRERFQAYVKQSGYGNELKAGDELQVRFTYEPQLNQRVIVRPDGKASFLKVGELQVEGLGFSDFEKKLRDAYSRFLREPDMSVYLLNSRTRKIYTDAGDITVLITSPQPKQVYIGGEVGAPKLVEFRDWLTPIQAIAEAGGYKDTADGARVIYITRAADGQALTMKIDLDAYLQGGRKLNLYLRHGDVLFVPRSGVAKLNLAVQQFIRNALPLQTSAGFTYVINNGDKATGSIIRVNPTPQE